MVLRSIDSEATLRQWFAVHVWAGREQFCAKHLTVRGYDIFLPCYRERRRWADRIKVVERALFSGYVFCRVSGSTVAKIVTAPGVIRIVGDANGPVPVSPHEIESLQHIVETGAAAQPWDFLKVGQRVQVVDGPLHGLEGIIVRSKGGHRLVISVDLLQRSVAVEIDPVAVRVAPALSFDGASYSVAVTDGGGAL